MALRETPPKAAAKEKKEKKKVVKSSTKKETLDDWLQRRVGPVAQNEAASSSPSSALEAGAVPKTPPAVRPAIADEYSVPSGGRSLRHMVTAGLADTTDTTVEALYAPRATDAPLREPPAAVVTVTIPESPELRVAPPDSDEDDPTIRQFMDTLTVSRSQELARQRAKAHSPAEWSRRRELAAEWSPVPSPSLTSQWSPAPSPSLTSQAAPTGQAQLLVSTPARQAAPTTQAQPLLITPTRAPQPSAWTTGGKLVEPSFYRERDAPSDYYHEPPYDDVAALVDMKYELAEVERKREVRRQAFVNELQSQAVLARERQRLELARRLDREEEDAQQMLRRSIFIGQVPTGWETPQQAQQNVVRAAPNCTLSRPAASLNPPPKQPLPRRPPPQGAARQAASRLPRQPQSMPPRVAVSRLVIPPREDYDDEQRSLRSGLQHGQTVVL